MAWSVNFSAGIQAAVYTYSRVRYIVSMVAVVSLEPRKPTDKFKILYNNNMIVRDDAVVTAKRRRGFRRRGFFSRKMSSVCLGFFLFLYGSFNFTSVDVLHHTRWTRDIIFSKSFFRTT